MSCLAYEKAREHLLAALRLNNVIRLQWASKWQAMAAAASAQERRERGLNA